MKWVSAPDSSQFVTDVTALAGREMIAAVVVIIVLITLFAKFLNSKTFQQLSGGNRAPVQCPFKQVETGRTAARFVPTSKPAKPRDASVSKDFLSNPVNQMEAISKVEFQKCRLLNREEYRLLLQLEKIIARAPKGYRLMAQTSLGEVIRPAVPSSNPKWKGAFASINSKRLDFAIFDPSGFLVCAIEYQGSGHHQGNAFMRDAVKKEALRRAGAPLVEIETDFSPEDVEAVVGRHLRNA